MFGPPCIKINITKKEIKYLKFYFEVICNQFHINYSGTRSLKHEISCANVICKKEDKILKLSDHNYVQHGNI